MKKNLVFYIFALLSIGASAATFDEIKNQSGEKSIPLINITVDIDKVNKPEYTECEIEIFDKQSRTNNSETVSLKAKIKYRGSSSMQYEKKSFTFKLLDETGEDLDMNMFGLREHDKWILDAMAIDRIRMRNRLCFDIWNDYSKLPDTHETDFGNRNGTVGLFVEVFINGEYHGLYCFTDEIDRKLLGVKKVKEEDGGNITVRGLLYKGSDWSDATQFMGYDPNASVDSDEWDGWELQYPDDYPSINTWKPLMDVIDCFSNGDTQQFAEEYGKHIYMDNLIDVCLLYLSVNDQDCFFKNNYISTPDINEETRFAITPWDMDMSFGSNYDGAYLESSADVKSFLSAKPITSYFYNNNIDGFNTKMSERWIEMSTTVLSPDAINKRIDTYSGQITNSGAWQREYDKWNNNPVELKENIEQETEYVKTWYQSNFDYLKSVFDPEKETGISQTFQELPIKAIGANGRIVLYSNEPQTVHIFDLSGNIIGIVNIVDGCAEINGLRPGIYIVGNQKVAVF